jgi:hypothetical protein
LSSFTFSNVKKAGYSAGSGKPFLDVATDPDPADPDPQPNAQQRILIANETSQLIFLEPHWYVFLSLSLYLRPRTARRKKTGCDDSGLSSLLKK